MINGGVHEAVGATEFERSEAAMAACEPQLDNASSMDSCATSAPEWDSSSGEETKNTILNHLQNHAETLSSVTTSLRAMRSTSSMEAVMLASWQTLSALYWQGNLWNSLRL